MKGNLAAGAVVALAWVIVSAASASAFDNGQFGDVPANVKSWFKSIKNKQDVPCCDLADGHILDGDDWTTKDNNYAVHIEGQWVPVPREAVIYDHGNPTNGAVVWYLKFNDDTIFVRCFVPGGGT